ncbi:hypothetical protein T05_1479 [Trichinella murrelli]|uniref:Peptidase aspartic putative domain-containing protein n=1 Tax=Trichinella murrelli TaxID=144512 RepID=A0A0V0T6K2_9BILA|nr:hypothetical protein T05_1479 [Trichinella murrelli]
MDVIVREHVKAIWNAKPCSDSGDSIQALVDEINRHLRCLTALGKNSSMGEMMANEAFLPLLAEKFPEEIRLARDVHVQSVSATKGDLPDFLNFAQVSAAAKRAAATFSCGRGLVKQDDPKQQEPGPGCRERQRTRQTEKRAARGATTVLHAAVNSSFPICKGDHDVASCKEFLQADAHTRSRMAARNKLCFRCLQSGHRAKAYKSPPRDQTPEAPRSQSCMLIANGGAQQVRLQSVRARAFGKDGQCVLVQCLLDPGSQSSFIRKDVADALGFTGPHEVIRLVTVDKDRGTERRMRRVEFHLHSIGAVDPSQPRPDARASPAQDLWKDSTSGSEAERMAPLVQSSDYYFNLVGGGVRRGPAGGPVAIHSQLGWILCGQTSRRPTIAVTTLLTHVEESADQILRRFWELEAIGIAADNQTAPPDEEALQRSEEVLTFDGERYEVHLPWLPSRPSLPNNFPQARRRLLAVECRLARCEEEKREYAATMRQYVENGWAERAPEIGLTTLYTKTELADRPAQGPPAIQKVPCRPASRHSEDVPSAGVLWLDMLSFSGHQYGEGARETSLRRCTTSSRGDLIKHWDRRGDFLTFSPPAVVNSQGGESKRSLLSTAFRVFDLVGCLTPFTVRAKMFLQTQWQRGTT